MTSLLSANDLCLIRGDRCLFKRVEFALNNGEMLLVEGANGSGKTSLLKAIAGLISLESGNVSWDGQDVTRHPQKFRAAMAWFSHRHGFKGDLTPVENLSYESGLRSFRDMPIEDALERVGLSAASALPVRSLSAGQQRRVGLARLLLAASPLWMLDEPFTNLDTAGQGLVRELLAEHMAEGGLCIVATHQAVAIDAPIHRVTL